MHPSCKQERQPLQNNVLVSARQQYTLFLHRPHRFNHFNWSQPSWLYICFMLQRLYNKSLGIRKKAVQDSYLQEQSSLFRQHRNDPRMHVLKRQQRVQLKKVDPTGASLQHWELRREAILYFFNWRLGLPSWDQTNEVFTRRSIHLAGNNRKHNLVDRQFRGKTKTQIHSLI